MLGWQLQLPSGSEDLEFRVYDNTLLSTALHPRHKQPNYWIHGVLEANNLASVRLVNKLWKESLSKRLVGTMTEGLLMPPPELSIQRSASPLLTSPSTVILAAV